MRFLLHKHIYLFSIYVKKNFHKIVRWQIWEGGVMALADAFFNYSCIFLHAPLGSDVGGPHELRWRARLLFRLRERHNASYGRLSWLSGNFFIKKIYGYFTRRGTRKMLFVFTQFLLGLLTLPVKVDVAYKERYIHVNIRTACTL